jgi:hypothetical protein
LVATQPVGGGAAALAVGRLQQEAEGLRAELAARQRRQLEPEAAPRPAPHPAPQPALQPAAANGFGTFTDGFFGAPEGAARQRELEAAARVERFESLQRRGEACIQAGQGGAVIPHTVTICHRPPFLRDLHRDLAAIAVVFCC